jgi:hypothetical protein
MNIHKLKPNKYEDFSKFNTLSKLNNTQQQIDEFSNKNLLYHQNLAHSYIVNLERTHTINNNEFTITTDSGIYCDPAGTGKTYVMIEAIKSNPSVPYIKNTMKEVYTPSLYISKNVENEILPITVIVTSIPKHWISLCTQLLKNFHIYDLEKVLTVNRSNPSVLIGTHTYAQKFFEMAKNSYISRIIYDDAHDLKFGGSCNTAFSWFITNNIEKFYSKSIKNTYNTTLNLKLQNIFKVSLPGIIFCNDNDIIYQSIKGTSIEKFYHPAIHEYKYDDKETNIYTLISNSRFLKIALNLGLENRYLTKDNCTDPITLDDISIPIQTNCCKQIFNITSLLKYYYVNQNNKCPLCREKIELTNCITYHNFDSKYDSLENTLSQLINNYDFSIHTVFVFINSYNSNITDLLYKHNIYTSVIPKNNINNNRLKIISGYNKGHYNLYIDYLDTSQHFFLSTTRNVVIISSTLCQEINDNYLNYILSVTNSLGRKNPLQVFKIIPSS